MPAVPGRSTDSRSVAGVGTTATSTALTAPAGSFDVVGDVGRTVTGAGIPAAATLTAVASATSATLSAAATATGTVAAALGAGLAASYGFSGWSPVADSESGRHTVAAVNAGQNAPSRITDTATRTEQRAR